MKKRQILIGISTLIFLFSFNIAFAYNVAYIVSNTLTVKQKHIDILHGIGFNVTVVRSSNISAINLSKYDFMLINNDQFTNPDSIPVNNHPALIMNTRYVYNWHWASSASQRAASQPLTAHVNNPNHFITLNLPWKIQIYDRSSYNGVDIPVYYLDRFVKSPYLKTVVSTDNATIYNTYNSVIATAESGTRLKDGYSSNTKSVFFGITESDFWSNETEKLFRRSALWLVTDLTSPVINNITVVNITNESAAIKWESDDKSNSTVEYGTTVGLGNIKEDANYLNSHTIYLTGLQEKTQYYYKISSCNIDGYCSEKGIFNFSTLDLTPPNILSVLLTNKTNSSVNISITTTEDSYSAIYYGILSLQYRTTTSGLSNKTDFYIDGLNEKSTYSYLVEACDKYGNCGNSSLYEFNTLDFTPPNHPKNLILGVINENNNIKVRWEAPDEEEISQYNIYITDNLIPFDFENPNAFTNLTEYTDNTAALSRQRYYAIRAEDRAGNEEKNRNIVAKFDLELVKGYHLISFPLIPFDADISKVMHQDALYKPVSEIKRYNGQGFEAVIYNDLTNQWNATIDLIPLEGYFFKSKQDANFTIVGYSPLSVAVGIVEGMNLKGLTLFENKQIMDIITQSPDDYNIKEIASRNSGGSYNVATYYNITNSWFNGFYVKPGIGYWVKANKNFSLVIEG